MNKVRILFFDGRFFAIHTTSSGERRIRAVYQPHDERTAGVLAVAWGIEAPADYSDPVVAMLQVDIATTHVVYLTIDGFGFVEFGNSRERKRMEEQADLEKEGAKSFPYPKSFYSFRKVFFELLEKDYPAEFLFLYGKARRKRNKAGQLDLERLGEFALGALEVIRNKLAHYGELAARYAPMAKKNLGDVTADLDTLNRGRRTTATITNFSSARVGVFYLEGRYYACVKREKRSDVLEILAIYKPDSSVGHGLLSVAWGVEEPGALATLEALLPARRLQATHNVSVEGGKIKFTARTGAKQRRYVVRDATTDEAAEYCTSMEKPKQLRDFAHRFRTVIGWTSAEANLYFATRVKKNEVYNLRFKKLKRYAVDAQLWVHKHNLKFRETATPFKGDVRGEPNNKPRDD